MTKRTLASNMCKLEGGKSQIKMADAMEYQTKLEAYFASMRVLENSEFCEAEIAMLERIEALEIKARQKMEKKNAKKTK